MLDLQNTELTELSKLQWVFKQTSGISDVSILKTKIIGALSSKTGEKVLEDAFEANKAQFQKLFGKSVTNVGKFIDKLNESDVFDKIFKVYE